MAGTESGVERRSADIILRGGTVVTMAPTRDVLAPGAVVIQGRDIVAVNVGPLTPPRGDVRR